VVDVDAHASAACDAYVREVLRFSAALNLTSVKQPEAFHRRFVVPSLALCRWMPKQGRLLDIGSGMGIPGIPILIACRGLQGVLVERRKKRAEFLRHVVRLLGLNAEVYDRDVQQLDCLHVDVCVARAVTRPEALLTMCAMHVRKGARAVFPVPDDSVPASLPAWRLEEECRVGADVMQKVQIYRYAEVSRET
jgi:16S rRNA (guanine(527)-N(7))-methyltransferase RsmG